MKNERTRKRELELLSTYLDGELNPSQRQALEARLQHDPNLQEQLENLRKTKIMVGYLPRLRAPRHYTLTPDMVTVRRQKKQPFLGTLRLASALAAILLVALLGVEFLFTSGPLAQPRLAAKPMMEAAVFADEAEPLILWGEPGVGGGEGAADGRGGDPKLMGEPVMAESMPIELEAPAEEALLPEEEPELMLQAEALPPMEEETGIQRLDLCDEEKMPILGINLEESGEIISRYADALMEDVVQPAWHIILRMMQIGLGAVAVAGGLAWWLLRRHGWG